MQKATSADGTPIAYDTVGSGPPVILVDGAFGTRAMGPNQPLAPLLAEHLTVVTYDRRGRGDSGDAPRSTIDREIEDIQALVDAVGGTAYLYGISSGAALALEAAARTPAVTKLALYEVPFVVDDTRPPVPDDYLAHLDRLLAAGKRADAVRYFMRTGIGVPAIVVALMRFMPPWPKLTAVAHTLPYDTLLTVEHQRGKPLPEDRWSTVTQSTLVASGTKSQQWIQNAMHALAGALPNAERVELKGQTHIVKPKALAPILEAFFVPKSTPSANGRHRAATATAAAR